MRAANRLLSITVHLVLILALGIVCPVVSSAQITTNTAYHIRYGSSTPALCNPATGDVFFKTSATITVYYCSATNTWSALSGGSATSLTAAQGTITTDLQALSTTATWNNAAVTFTHWKANVTDSASNASSLLMDLQVGAASKFKVDKTGIATVATQVLVGDTTGGGSGNTLYSGASDSNTTYSATTAAGALRNTSGTVNTFTLVSLQNRNASGTGVRFASFGAQATTMTAGAQTGDFVIATLNAGSDTIKWRVKGGGSLLPETDNLYTAGDATHRVAGLYVGTTGIAHYSNVATAGWGVPAIYGSGRALAQTGAVASVATYTVGAADGSFLVSANVNVTTATSHSFSVVVTYTDEANVSRSLILPMTQGTTFASAVITNTTGTGPYSSPAVHIRCKAATAITITTSGTFTTVTYNVEGTITQIA